MGAQASLHIATPKQSQDNNGATLINADEDTPVNEDTDDNNLHKEVLIIDNALYYGLTRWIARFPKESAEEKEWPFSFSAPERKLMRDWMRRFLELHPDTKATKRPQEEFSADVEEITSSKKYEDFPVKSAKAANIIHQLLEDVKNIEQRRQNRKKEDNINSAGSSSMAKKSGVDSVENEWDEDSKDEVVH